jgi:phage terminase small subunit
LKQTLEEKCAWMRDKQAQKRKKLAEFEQKGKYKIMGALRQPDSKRGIKEGLIIDNPEEPIAPDWLSIQAQKEFHIMVRYLIDASVPLKQIDSYALGMAAYCVSNVAAWSERENEADTLHEKLSCAKVIARYQGDSQKWLSVIGGTPKARAQIGIKSTKRNKAR